MVHRQVLGRKKPGPTRRGISCQTENNSEDEEKGSYEQVEMGELRFYEGKSDKVGCGTTNAGGDRIQEGVTIKLGKPE